MLTEQDITRQKNAKSFLSKAIKGLFKYIGVNGLNDKTIRFASVKADEIETSFGTWFAHIAREKLEEAISTINDDTIYDRLYYCGRCLRFVKWSELPKSRQNNITVDERCSYCQRCTNGEQETFIIFDKEEIITTEDIEKFREKQQQVKIVKEMPKKITDTTREDAIGRWLTDTSNMSMFGNMLQSIFTEKRCSTRVTAVFHEDTKISEILKFGYFTVIRMQEYTFLRGETYKELASEDIEMIRALSIDSVITTVEQ